MNDTFINAAIRTLQELNADVKPHNVWIILDLQGIADDISYEDIIEACMKKNKEQEQEIV